MGRKKKEAEVESFDLCLRPEQIVKRISEGDRLDDFNPYGDYFPEQSRFLGDTRPKDTPYFIGINEDDEDILAIYISTPNPPALELIDGYGMHPDDQIWVRPEIPKKLKELERKAIDELQYKEKRNAQETVQGYKVYQKYWEILNENQKEYAVEIEWIKKMWWHRVNGYWCYVDGEPLFFTGDYFDYLTFWYLADIEAHPDFREEDRKIFCFSRYLENTQESFVNINPDTGRAVRNEDGTYDMTDIGARTFFGELTPKYRRTGETQRGCHKLWKSISTAIGAYGTLVSMDGDNAEKHYYKKLIPSWQKYPMFLKPVWIGNRRPQSVRMIEPPNMWTIEGLGSTIDYTDSKKESKNDGDTLNYLLADEEGKTTGASIFERWNVNKMAMSRGGGTKIIGYSSHPSTVEEMDAGGLEYYKMAQLSSFYERTPSTGQTFTELARVFIPAYKKLEGFIDKWGKSVIDKPTERQRKASPRERFAVLDKGAREVLQEQLDALLMKGTPEALEAYRSRRRKFPMKWADCWLGSAGNVGYNMEIIDKRLAEINQMRSFDKPPYKEGYFYRENPNDKHSRVRWKNDPDNPKFKMSKDIAEALTNRMTSEVAWDYTRGRWVTSYRPVDGFRFTLGVDPYKNLKQNEAKTAFKIGASTSNSKQSDGGLCMIWEYDESVDRGRKKEDWETDRVILTYRWRPATWGEFLDDTVMAAQYFGAMIFPEYNIEAVVKELIDMGYGGFLLYDMDIVTGKPKPMPGKWTDGNTWQEVMVETKDYIEFHGAKENHDDLLMEFKGLRGIEDFTHKDLHAAFGMAKLGSKSRFRQLMQASTNASVIDLDGVWKKSSY